MTRVVSLGKGFHYTIYLLGLFGKTDHHQEPSQSDVQGIETKLEFTHKQIECGGMNRVAASKVQKVSSVVLDTTIRLISPVC
jgi:hypothetical protein